MLSLRNSLWYHWHHITTSLPASRRTENSKKLNFAPNITHFSHKLRKEAEFQPRSQFLLKTLEGWREGERERGEGDLTTDVLRSLWLRLSVSTHLQSPPVTQPPGRPRLRSLLSLPVPATVSRWGTVGGEPGLTSHGDLTQSRHHHGHLARQPCHQHQF